MFTWNDHRATRDNNEPIIGDFLFSPPLPLFFSELLELERCARCWHRIALVRQGSDFVVVSDVSLCLIPLSRPAPTYHRSSSSLARVWSTWAACTALPDVVMEHARSPLRTTDEENANNLNTNEVFLKVAASGCKSTPLFYWPCADECLCSTSVLVLIRFVFWFVWVFFYFVL